MEIVSKLLNNFTLLTHNKVHFNFFLYKLFTVTPFANM